MERSSDKQLSMQLATRERCRERMSITSLINGTDSSANSHAHARNADRQSNAPSAVLVVNLTAGVVLPLDLQGNTPSPIWDHSSHEINSKRPTRPPYTEEQKFFIMFARVLDQQSWLDIEDRFLEVFGRPASRDGLTSMYYRIRKSWGLKDILMNGPQSYVEDQQAVHEKAAYLSQDFLTRIGYLHH